MGMRKYKRQIAREIMAKHGMKFKSDGVFEKIFTGNRMTRQDVSGRRLKSGHCRCGREC